MGRAKQLIDVKKLSSWKLLDAFRERLATAQARLLPNPPPHDPKRLLLEKFGRFAPTLF